MFGKEYLIRLPWPDRWLSANAANGTRVARLRAHKAKKEARSTAWALAREQGVIHAMQEAELHFTYHPPDNRRRDPQNLPHMLKPAIDGIADAMGCDDSGFACHFPPRFSEVVKGGCVLVHIKSAYVTLPMEGGIS